MSHTIRHAQKFIWTEFLNFSITLIEKCCVKTEEDRWAASQNESHCLELQVLTWTQKKGRAEEGASQFHLRKSRVRRISRIFKMGAWLTNLSTSSTSEKLGSNNITVTKLNLRKIFLSLYLKPQPWSTIESCKIPHWDSSFPIAWISIIILEKSNLINLFFNIHTIRS